MRPTGPRLVVIGDASIDLLLEVDRRVAADEKVTAVSSLRRLGGTGANAAVAAAGLGSDVELVAAIGDDRLGPWIRDGLANRGLATSGLVTVAGNSTLAVIVLEGGGRTVIVDRGVADQLPLAVAAQRSADADLVYVSGLPTEVVAASSRASMMRLVVGIEARQLGGERASDWQTVLEGAFVVIVNRAGELALDLAGIDIPSDARGGCAVIVTRGPDGCTIRQPGEPTVDIPALRVAARDATGAGDYFAGALCHRLLQGAGLVDAARFATAAAGMSTTVVGAQTWLPSEGEVAAAAAGIFPRYRT